MSDYTPTIGLEIHAQLKTNTKMFCDSKNDPDETRPNVNVCPVCMGHPGTLPVVNKAAVLHVLRVGLALGGELATHTHFDRKNYFYPDIPKGYQISQYDEPLVSGGELSSVTITRVHLEEDTARSIHPVRGEGDEKQKDGAAITSNGADESGEYSLVDFNRAGIPLMELVTEPVIKTAEDAGNFARELQLLLRTLGAGDANMEKGEMRIEANVSISKTDEFGTKVEVKNINSFKAVERAIAHEIKRQEEVLESGGEVVQETRGWDENKEVTVSQRKKESSHDYRYFPDPDLPQIDFSSTDIDFDELQSGLPELPWEKRERLTEEYNIKSDDIETLLGSDVLGTLFDEVEKELDDTEIIGRAVNYLTSDLAGLLKESDGETKIEADAFATLMKMVDDNKLSSRGAKDVLAVLHAKGGDPETIAEEENLLQVSDERALQELAKEIIKDHEEAVKEYQEGKEEALKFLIGQGMRISKGSANPKKLEEILKKEIS